MRTGAVTPQRIRKLRDLQGWGAELLGQKLGYTRAYIKSLEGGSLPVTHRVAVRFAALERETYREALRHRQIKTLYPLPKEIKNTVRPRRCRKCREWFLFPVPNQRTCTGCRGM